MSVEWLRAYAERLRREIREEERRLLDKHQRARLIEAQIRYAENRAWLARSAGNYILEQRYLSQIPELRNQLTRLRQEIAREQARLDQLAAMLRSVENRLSLEVAGRLGRVYKRTAR